VPHNPSKSISRRKNRLLSSDLLKKIDDTIDNPFTDQHKFDYSEFSDNRDDETLASETTWVSSIIYILGWFFIHPRAYQAWPWLAPCTNWGCTNWGCETHTFHLRYRETTPTLQDIVVLLGLSIDGHVIISTSVCTVAKPQWVKRGQLPPYFFIYILKY